MKASSVRPSISISCQGGPARHDNFGHLLGSPSLQQDRLIVGVHRQGRTCEGPEPPRRADRSNAGFRRVRPRRRPRRADIGRAPDCRWRADYLDHGVWRPESGGRRFETLGVEVRLGLAVSRSNADNIVSLPVPLFLSPPPGLGHPRCLAGALWPWGVQASVLRSTFAGGLDEVAAVDLAHGFDPIGPTMAPPGVYFGSRLSLITR